jgi:hypothetical protein
MKEILKFSDYCRPANEIYKRNSLRNDSLLHMILNVICRIYIPPILMILSYYILVLVGYADLFIFAIFFVFLLIHCYCFYFKKMLPYLFPNSAFFQNLVLRGLYPLVIIFIPINTEISFYPLIVGIVFFLFLQRLYIKGYFTGVSCNIRHPESYVKELTEDMTFYGCKAETNLFYTEIVILILAFLLPFQDSVPFDIERISIFVYSFNCFTLLLLIHPIRDLITRIFSRLSKALAVFCALASFTLVLSIQLKNLYFLDYPAYFLDITTSLKTLTLIITGEFFVELNNNDAELYILVFGIYSFLGIILLSFFTAFLVDSEKTYNFKELIGRINFKNVYLVVTYDASKMERKPLEVIYNNKVYKCNDIITEIDGFHHDFDIIDAAVLISKNST